MADPEIESPLMKEGVSIFMTSYENSVIHLPLSVTAPGEKMAPSMNPVAIFGLLRITFVTNLKKQKVSDMRCGRKLCLEKVALTSKDLG